jgi:hypothetical protein
MIEPEDWRQRIVQMILVKQKIAELDTQQLWEYRLPGVAARQEKLRAAEAQIGEPLDPACRDFLGYADGWPAFYHAMDLFGTGDLIGDRVHEAAEVLAYIDDVVFDISGLRREQLIPIAANTNDMVGGKISGWDAGRLGAGLVSLEVVEE